MSFRNDYHIDFQKLTKARWLFSHLYFQSLKADLANLTSLSLLTLLIFFWEDIGHYFLCL